mmetsp:Transcript_42092/g.95929  ORF Transcript_42092/g.95929 Transcript_42092/m.95929 type:complete len:214 (+) Transcript_42092:50-691(+)
MRSQGEDPFPGAADGGPMPRLPGSAEAATLDSLSQEVLGIGFGSTAPLAAEPSATWAGPRGGGSGLVRHAGIPFSVFPEDVQRELEAMDEDGDRTLGPSEILEAFRIMKKLKGGGIPFSVFPEDVQRELEAMDGDGDRTLGPSEIVEAFRIMKKMKGAMESGGITIDSFPEHLRKKLQQFDGSGDGVIDAEVLESSWSSSLAPSGACCSSSST